MQKHINPESNNKQRLIKVIDMRLTFKIVPSINFEGVIFGRPQSTYLALYIETQKTYFVGFRQWLAGNL